MEQVTETVKPNNGSEYTARIRLTNSGKVGFTRRDLSLCFYPPKVVEKADRNYDTLVIKGVSGHEDNPEWVNALFSIIPKQFVYNGTVKKITKHSFNWSLIATRLCKDYNLKRIRTLPDRKKIIDWVEITTNESDYNKHAGMIRKIREIIRLAMPILTFEIFCEESWHGPCKIAKTDII